MDSVVRRVMPRNVKVSAEANFTLDMAQNLLLMFSHIEADQEVTVKFSNKGVWAVTPDGVRLFIGSTEPFNPNDTDPEVNHERTQ